MKQHFIFDVDDTITNSYEFNQQMFVDTFAGILNLSDLQIEKYLRDLHYRSRGIAMHRQFEEALNFFGITFNPHELVSKNEELHKKNIENIELFDAVVDVIKSLKNSGKTVSVCSNRQSGSLSLIINKHGLGEYMDNIVSCIDAGHEKPDPYCLETLVHDKKYKKNECIYFGDSKTDSLFASNAGIDFIIVDHYINEKKFYKMILQAFM